MEDYNKTNQIMQAATTENRSLELISVKDDRWIQLFQTYNQLSFHWTIVDESEEMATSTSSAADKNY